MTSTYMTNVALSVLKTTVLGTVPRITYEL